MKDQYTKLINKTVWVVIILFIIRCLVSWGTLIEGFSAYDIYGYAGEAIGVTAIIISCYERWLWKYNPLEDTPVLKKHYKGTIESTYDGIIREANLEIRQTLLSVHVTLVSGESKSKSISSSIDDILGEKQLTYCYLNTPKASFRDRSEIHYGTAILCIDNPNILNGQYFSDRKTTGDMLFYPNSNNITKFGKENNNEINNGAI